MSTASSGISGIPASTVREARLMLIRPGIEVSGLAVQ